MHRKDATTQLDFCIGRCCCWVCRHVAGVEEWLNGSQNHSLMAANTVEPPAEPAWAEVSALAVIKTLK
jgi:hypothetical protein